MYKKIYQVHAREVENVTGRRDWPGLIGSHRSTASAG
jgi:hypothetical protein